MKRLLFAVILCLILSTVTGADSAWVLWELKIGKNEAKQWEIVRAYPTYQECVQNRDFWINLSPYGEKYKEIIGTAPSAPDPNCPECIWVDSRQGEKYLSFKKDGITTTVIAPNIIVRGSPKTGYFSIKYECLPDTIDPRK